jgi:Xaa-Pro aminopeptidase
MKSNLPALMKERDLDALLVWGNGFHNSAMVYFTGVVHITDAILVLKRGEEPILFVHPMERDEAAATGLKVADLGKFNYRQLFEESGENALLATARLQQLALTEAGLTAGRVALYGQRDAGESVALANAIQELLPGIEFVGEISDSVLLQARATKDAAEIDVMRKVARLTTEVVAQVADFLGRQRAKNGVLVDDDSQPITVGQVKQHINLWLAERGLENPEGTIFAPGAEAGVPHSLGSSEAMLRLGEPIIFDIFPVQSGGGYFADFTRTWCLGYASDEAHALYQDVRFVYETIMGELKVDGLCMGYQDRTCELFAERGHPTVAEDPLTKEGYVHGLAHGLGLDVHENPRASRNATTKDVLQIGSVITVEPGLYYPQRGLGCRIEDAVAVKEDGSFEVLAPYPLDLVIPLKKTD